MLRHEPLGHVPVRRRPDLRSTFRDIVPHRRIRQPVRGLLINQPGQHPPGRMPLLAWRRQICDQHCVDRRLEPIQHRRRPVRRLPFRRDRRLQCLTHRAPVHMMPLRQRPNRQTLDPLIASDRGEQLHPGLHPAAPLMINNQLLITTVRWGHFRPSQPARRVTKVGPNQTVTPGPNQTVTATRAAARPATPR
jgi:hypothetical protein